MTRQQTHTAGLPTPQDRQKPPPNQNAPAKPSALPPGTDPSQKAPPKKKSKGKAKETEKENTGPSASTGAPPSKPTKAQLRTQAAQASVTAAEAHADKDRTRRMEEDHGRMARELAQLKALYKQKCG